MDRTEISDRSGYRDITTDGLLRHTTFLALYESKVPRNRWSQNSNSLPMLPCRGAFLTRLGLLASLRGFIESGMWFGTPGHSCMCQMTPPRFGGHLPMLMSLSLCNQRQWRQFHRRKHPSPCAMDFSHWRSRITILLAALGDDLARRQAGAVSASGPLRPGSVSHVWMSSCLVRITGIAVGWIGAHDVVWLRRQNP